MNSPGRATVKSLGLSSTLSDPALRDMMPGSHSLSVVSSTGSPPSVVDGQAIREGLGALRAGQEEIEQFVSALFEELDAAWTEVEQDHVRLNAERQKLAETQADFSTRRAQWETDHRQRTDALQHRVVELEKDRLVLKAELEAARAQAAGLHQTLAEIQQRIAAERSEWNIELRLLREVLDRQAGSVFGPAVAPTELPANNPTILPGDPMLRCSEVTAESPPPANLPPYLPLHLSPQANPPVPIKPKDVQQRLAQAVSALAAETQDPILGPLLSRFRGLKAEAQRSGGALEKGAP